MGLPTQCAPLPRRQVWVCQEGWARAWTASQESSTGWVSLQAQPRLGSWLQAIVAAVVSAEVACPELATLLMLMLMLTPVLVQVLVVMTMTMPTMTMPTMMMLLVCVRAVVLSCRPQNRRGKVV